MKKPYRRAEPQDGKNLGSWVTMWKDAHYTHAPNYYMNKKQTVLATVDIS